MRLLAISGSLRAASTNLRLLEAFKRHAPEAVSIDIFESLGELPIFSPDLETGAPRPVLALAESVGRCEGLLVASPEYAHGIPGGLKNALDWLVSRHEIPGKPVMMARASTRGLVSREHLREVLTTMSCRMFPGPAFEMHLIGKAPSEADDLLDAPESRRRIDETLSAFRRYIELNSGPE